MCSTPPSLKSILSSVSAVIEVLPLASKINSIISKNSYSYFEINPKSLKNIEKICKNNNFHNFQYIDDLSGKKRFVLIKN